MVKNTKTPASPASIPMASWSKRNRELQRFTSPNSRKKLKSAFIMTSEGPAHTPRSRLQITQHIKGSRKRPNVNEKMRQQRTTRFQLNKKQPKIELKHCKPATTSLRGRKTIC